MNRWLVSHILMLGAGWWFSDMNSPSFLHAGIAPLAVALGGMGLCLWFVLRRAGASRRTGGGAGITSGEADAGDSN